MKKIFAHHSFVIAVLAAALMLPSGVSAFLPFSSGNPQVLGATTQSGFFGILMQKFFHTEAPTAPPTSNTINGSAPEGATGALPNVGTSVSMPPVGVGGPGGMM